MKFSVAMTELRIYPKSNCVFKNNYKVSNKDNRMQR